MRRSPPPSTLTPNSERAFTSETTSPARSWGKFEAKSPPRAGIDLTLGSLTTPRSGFPRQRAVVQANGGGNPGAGGAECLHLPEGAFQAKALAVTAVALRSTPKALMDAATDPTFLRRLQLPPFSERCY